MLTTLNEQIERKQSSVKKMKKTEQHQSEEVQKGQKEAIRAEEEAEGGEKRLKKQHRGQYWELQAKLDEMEKAAEEDVEESGSSPSVSSFQLLLRKCGIKGEELLGGGQIHGKRVLYESVGEYIH